MGMKSRQFKPNIILHLSHVSAEVQLVDIMKEPTMLRFYSTHTHIPRKGAY